MKKILLSILLLTSLLLFSQTPTDKLVQNAANYIKSENYSGALSILKEADQNDYRVSYMQIISRYAILQVLQETTNAQSSAYISKYGNKNAGYTRTVSTILKRLNGAVEEFAPDYMDEPAYIVPEPTVVNLFSPIKYGSETEDFVWLAKKTKKLFTTPNYALINNPKEISEFLKRYEDYNSEDFFQGVINFCHFYEINSENKDGTGKRKMLDLRNGQMYDVPAKNLACATQDLVEFVNNSNIYILNKCDDGKSVTNTYSWDEKSKKFSLIKTEAN